MHPIAKFLFVVVFLATFAALARAQTSLTVDGLPPEAPLSVRAIATSEVLVVDLELDPDWHAYVRDVGGGQPIIIELDEECAFQAAGPLQFSPDHNGKVVGDVRVRLPLSNQGASGSLRADLRFVICDPLACLPPMRVTLTGSIPRLRVMLVVDERDEHAARIQEFLEDRGFAVHPRTYAEVTKEECDAQDVVILDSVPFEPPRVQKYLRHAIKFPKTETPIVAVGFYGTEIVEAHGIAMTSGYI